MASPNTKLIQNAARVAKRFARWAIAQNIEMLRGKRFDKIAPAHIQRGEP